MSSTHTLGISLALVTLATPTARAATDAPATVRRFALVAGVNDGGPARVALRFAASDAETFARVMEDLGGIGREDRLLLLNPDRRALMTGIDDLAAMIKHARKPGQRQEAIFYYSGHSDENGLLLQGERVEYKELRLAMQALPADVRIAVVDSCASGALTRIKGGKWRPSFLVDSSTQLTGQAYLTSSSATEAAQESDRIGASFFTHFLVSGLRGAADVSGDGKVTLTEAYQFAFNETLAKTENSRGGAQHPNYDFDLSGSGDLVMTDLRTTSAALLLEQGLAGRFYVRDANGQLVVELYKLGDRAVELGLSPGDYQVTLDDRGSLSKATVALSQGSKVSLGEKAFVHVDGEPTRSRGGAEPGKVAAAETGVDTESAEPFDVAPAKTRRPVEDEDELVDYDVQYCSFELFPGVFGKSKRKVLKHFSFNLLAGYADRLDGFEISSGVNLTGESVSGLQVAAGANLDRGTLSGALISGGLNLAKLGGRGLMVSGGANVAGEGFLGLQVAGGFNLAKAMRGAQLAVVNVTGDLTGAQVGVVNIATGTVSGTQVGVVNLANTYEGGVPVGLLSLVKNAGYHAELYGSDLAPMNLALRMDVTEHAYTILTLGYAPGRDDEVVPVFGRGRARAHWGFGMGGKVPLIGGLGLRFDGIVGSSYVGDTTGHVNGRWNDTVLQLRAGVTFALFDHLGVFAGAGLTSYMTWKPGRDTSHLSGRLPSRSVHSGDFGMRQWPGVFGGVLF